MNDQSKGIVISLNECKENDVILNVLSEDYGKISLYCKGFKKITSKNAFACQLFDDSSFLFDYSESRDVSLLKSASLNNEFYGIKSDYNKLVIASFIAELVNNNSDGIDYASLKQIMQLLNDGDQPFLIVNLFLVGFLQMNGIAPYVDGCTLCENTDGIETISIEDGGFICSRCNKTLQLEKMDVSLLHKFRVINKASFAVMDKLMGYNEPKLTSLLLQILLTYSGVRLKSVAALEKIL